ncbi:MAG: hypothetical protein ACXW3M_15340 [Rhodoplanes sp.]
MAQSTKSEQRFLSDEEIGFVSQSHHPALRDLTEDALQSLIKLLRDRRDRAGDIARRQRREMRGKAQPAGSRPATDDSGTRMKRQILAAALKRANKERQRRRYKAAREEQVASAWRALAMKRASAGKSHRPPSTDTAAEGMRANPSQRAPDLVRPRKVGRVSQFVKDAQARRDAK